MLLAAVLCFSTGSLRAVDSEAVAKHAAATSETPTAGTIPASLSHNQARSPHTDREGQALPARVLARIGSIRLRNVPQVTYLAFSSDSRFLASGGQNPPLTIWNTANGMPVHRLGAYGFAEAVGAFLDSNTVVSVTAQGGGRVDFRLWDVPHERELKHIDGGERPSSCSLAVSPEGHWAVCGPEGIEFYGRGDAQLRRIARAERRAPKVALSRDGRRLAVTDINAIRVIDTGSGKEILSLKGENQQFGRADFSPDGRILAAASRLPPCSVCLWEAATGRVIRRLMIAEGSNQVSIATFSPDGRLIAAPSSVAGTIPGVIQIWETTSGKERRRIQADCIGDVLAFSPDDKTIALANMDGEITLWEVASGAVRPASAEPTSQISRLRFASRGKQLLGTCDRLRAWDVVTGREVWRAPVEALGFDQLAVSPDGTMLAGAADSAIKIWHAHSGRQLRTIDTAGHDAFLVRFSGDGKRVAAACSDQHLRVWDVATGRPRLALAVKDPIQALLVSPDGGRLVALGSDPQPGAARIWELADGRETRMIHLPFQTKELALSPSGKLLAAVGHSDSVFVWNIDNGIERSFRTPCESSDCVAFSLDNRMIATGDEDKVVRIWEVASGKLRQALTGHAQEVKCVAFADDGRLLASASAEAPIYLWDIAAVPRDAEKTAVMNLQQCWKDLASDDAALGWRAVRRLAAAGDRALPFLRQHLNPEPPLDATRVRSLVKLLDSDRFIDRKKAADELERLGARASVLLKQIRSSAQSAEVRQTLEHILNRPWPTEDLRKSRAVEAIERMNVAGCRAVLEELSRGAADAPLTRDADEALKRIHAGDGASSP
jgi:WD40 repeat protein